MLTAGRCGALGLGLWLGLVVPAFSHGAFHERQAQMQAAINEQPGDALLRCRLAELYGEHGEFTEALAALDSARAIDPQLALVDLVRADIFLQTGRAREACGLLDGYIAKNSGNAHARLLRARARLALGEKEKAISDYRAALAMSRAPEPDLYQEVGDAMAVQRMTVDALAVFEAGLRKLGPIPSLTLRAMDIEVATGRYEAALARVDVLQRSSPRPEPWMAKRASLLAQAGRKVEAREAWTALANHLAALPNLERGSHAMSLLAEQARRALAAL
ncbi:MAG: tetratricopeptide repeat protein [Opitutaceae bacterium]|nr:tetratricopeptide repeat protein [Opitutaceae bacterium]